MCAGNPMMQLSSAATRLRRAEDCGDYGAGNPNNGRPLAPLSALSAVIIDAPTYRLHSKTCSYLNLSCSYRDENCPVRINCPLIITQIAKYK